MLKLRTTRSGGRNDGHCIHYKRTHILLWWQRRFKPRAATAHTFYLTEWVETNEIKKIDPLWVKIGWD